MKTIGRHHPSPLPQTIVLRPWAHSASLSKRFILSSFSTNCLLFGEARSLNGLHIQGLIWGKSPEWAQSKWIKRASHGSNVIIHSVAHFCERGGLLRRYCYCGPAHLFEWCFPIYCSTVSAAWHTPSQCSLAPKKEKVSINCTSFNKG